MAKSVSNFCPVRGATVESLHKTQKMYQKSMVKNSMRFRAQNRHGKITKNVKNVAKK